MNERRTYVSSFYHHRWIPEDRLHRWRSPECCYSPHLENKADGHIHLCPPYKYDLQNHRNANGISSQLKMVSILNLCWVESVRSLYQSCQEDKHRRKSLVCQCIVPVCRGLVYSRQCPPHTSCLWIRSDRHTHIHRCPQGGAHQTHRWHRLHTHRIAQTPEKNKSKFFVTLLHLHRLHRGIFITIWWPETNNGFVN